MEPITTAAMIGGIVTYLSAQVAKNESIKSFVQDFTGATVNWIRPLFLTANDTETEVIQQLRAKPESKARQNALVSKLEIALEDRPEAEVYIKEIFEKIAKTEEGGKVVNNIINSRNVNTGNVNIGTGDFILGDGHGK